MPGTVRSKRAECHKKHSCWVISWLNFIERFPFVSPEGLIYQRIYSCAHSCIQPDPCVFTVLTSSRFLKMFGLTTDMVLNICGSEAWNLKEKRYPAINFVLPLCQKSWAEEEHDAVLKIVTVYNRVPKAAIRNRVWRAITTKGNFWLPFLPRVSKVTVRSNQNQTRTVPGCFCLILQCKEGQVGWGLLQPREHN